MSPLAHAAKKREWETVKWLIFNGACVNMPSSSGWYPVYAALKDSNLEMLELFMKKGVDIYGYKKITNNHEVIKPFKTFYSFIRKELESIPFNRRFFLFNKFTLLINLYVYYPFFLRFRVMIVYIYINIFYLFFGLKIRQKCETYMRQRRRNHRTESDGGDRGRKNRRRCKCGSENSDIRES